MCFSFAKLIISSKKIGTDMKESGRNIYVFDNHCHKVFVCLMKLAKCSMVKSNYGNFCSRENHAHRVGPSQNCLLANSCQCIKYASLTLLIFLSGRFVSLKPEIRTYLFAKWHSTMKRPNKVCCESSQKKMLFGYREQSNRYVHTYAKYCFFPP